MAICWLTNCSIRVSRLGLDWLGLKACYFMGNPGGFWDLVFGLNWEFNWEDEFDHQNLGWFIH